jgi:hypothetical protein
VKLLFVIAAATAAFASSASAEDRKAPTWELPDGNKLAIVRDAKTSVLGVSSTTVVVFFCSPTCRPLRTDVTTADGALAGVPKAAAYSLGLVGAAIAHRPDRTSLYNGSYSQSDAQARGGNALNDFSSQYYDYSRNAFVVPAPPPVPPPPPPPETGGKG